MTYDPLNVPTPPSAVSSPDPGTADPSPADPGDHGPDQAPTDPRDPSTFPRFASSVGPDLATPGPHPHEAADIHMLAGDVARNADPTDGFTDPEPLAPPAGITGALPGPHPHAASDIRDGGGLVAGWADPMAGFADDDDSGH